MVQNLVGNDLIFLSERHRTLLFEVVMIDDVWELLLEFDVMVHFVLQNPVQNVPVFIPTEGFLLNLVDLVTPETCICFFVAVKLRFLGLINVGWHLQAAMARDVPTWYRDS